MKNLFLTLTIIMFTIGGYAQNTFPTPGGNVGIGTTSPLTTLHVVGNGGWLGNILTTVTPLPYLNGLSSGLGFCILSNTSFVNKGAVSNIGLLQRNSSPNDIEAGVYLSIHGWYQNSETSLPISLGGGYLNIDPSLYIAAGGPTGAGNVGIGTTNPQSKLDVKGSIVYGGVNSNGRLGDELGYATVIGGAGAGIKFYTNDGVSQPLTLSGIGNVSIGTTDSKGYKLAVAGSVIAESVTVKLQSQWPDYVFKSSYNLPSLTRVKAYIRENGHLPDMPSESEVKQNGLDVGEMLKMQTRKIEELTLYLIDKDRQVQEQQKLAVKQNARLKQLEARLVALEYKLRK